MNASKRTYIIIVLLLLIVIGVVVWLVFFRQPKTDLEMRLDATRALEAGTADRNERMNTAAQLESDIYVGDAERLEALSALE